jgi:hypothetical protein
LFDVSAGQGYIFYMPHTVRIARHHDETGFKAGVRTERGLGDIHAKTAGVFNRMVQKTVSDHVPNADLIVVDDAEKGTSYKLKPR